MSKTKLAVVLLLTVAATGIAFALLYHPPWLESERRATPDTGSQVAQDQPQGVSGRVQLPNGSPAEGALVRLVPIVSTNPITAFLAARTTGEPTPIATGRTLADGSFALPIANATHDLELQVTAAELPAITKGGIDVDGGEWFDAGTVQFGRGALVAGRVLDKATGQPIANATVHVHPGSSVLTDAGGAFRCTTVPDGAAVRIKVEADGYATNGLRNVAVDAAKENAVELQLEAARTLRGVVLDDKRAPIVGARVTARRIDNGFAGPVTVATRADGAFSIEGVANAAYRLTVTAPKHVEATLQVPNDGERIGIRLDERGTVKLRVTAPDGATVIAFEVSFLRKAGNHTSFAPIRGLAPRRLDAASHDGGWATVDDLPHGRLRAVIDDGTHAATVSASFDLAPGAEAPEVDVQLIAGAAVRGKVVDSHGKPIANALVIAKPEQEYASTFSQPAPTSPDTRATRSAKTDARGQYIITGLSKGPHTLHASRETFFYREPEDIAVAAAGAVVAANPLILRQGAILQGTASVAGKPTGQIEIELRTHPSRRHWDPKSTFFARTMSDEKGRYRFLQSVPPGHYWISGARKNASPQQRLITMKTTGRALMVNDITKPIEVPFDLPHPGN